MATYEYELGKEVTDKIKSKAKGTVVFSVRLTTDELKRLEVVSQESGKTVSQVVREAINSYSTVTSLTGRVLTTFSFVSGPTISSGEFSQIVSNSRQEPVLLREVR
jgi:hypothetical protein